MERVLMDKAKKHSGDLDAAIELAKMLESMGIEVSSRYGDGSKALEELAKLEDKADEKDFNA
jgi:hypothetical protein